MWITPKTNWNINDFYNFDDLNRVETNTEHVKSLLQQLGRIINIISITERTMEHIEFSDSLNRIESNIDLMGSAYGLNGWHPLKLNWVYNDAFGYLDANRYESNLLLLKVFAERNINSLRHCGTFYSGEEAL